MSIGVGDGPVSSLFAPVSFNDSMTFAGLVHAGISDEMAAALEHAPAGEYAAWGIPFEIGAPVAIKDQGIIVGNEIADQ